MSLWFWQAREKGVGGWIPETFQLSCQFCFVCLVLCIEKGVWSSPPLDRMGILGIDGFPDAGNDRWLRAIHAGIYIVSYLDY